MEGQLVKLLAALMVCTGCLMTYLASNRQRLLAKPALRELAWITFAVLQAAAILLLASVYGPVAGALLVLVLVVCLWTGLVLAAAHLHGRPLLVGSLAAILSSLIMVTG